jgi:hypothetical protein
MAARHYGCNQCAGRQAGTVDDDALSGAAQRYEIIEIGSDLAAFVAGDPHCGTRRHRYDRHHKHGQAYAYPHR